MADLHRLPDPSEVERDACLWVARLEADDVSDDDRARFDDWRSAHPLHARIYDEVRVSWQEFTDVGPLVRFVSFGQSMLAAGKSRRPDLRWVFAAAASIALVIMAGSWYFERRTSESFRTAIGEHAEVTMSDGSTVELNSNTLARVEFSRKLRVIRLDRGEAYFKVSRDPQRPFLVLAQGSRVRAVGTEFNVDIRPSLVRVTVSEGKVKAGPELAGSAESPDEVHSVAVSAGEQVDIDGRTVATSIMKLADLGRATAWRTGTAFFENDPLGDVIAELSRYTTLKIIVRDPSLTQMPIGGTFLANPQGAEALVAMLQDGLGLSVHREDGTVYVDSAPTRENESPVRH